MKSKLYCYIDKDCPYFESAYSRAQQDTGIPEWLTADYIRGLHVQFEILGNYMDDVLAALDEIVKNAELLLLVKTLYYMATVKKSPFETFASLNLPENPPLSDNLGYRLILLFPVLGHMREAYLSLKERKIDDDILKKTFMFVDENIAQSTQREGRLAVNKLYFKWMLLYFHEKLLSIGCLGFEIVDECKHPIRVFSGENGQIKIMMDKAWVHKSGNILGTEGFKDEHGSFYAEVFEDKDCYEGYAVDGRTSLIQSKKTRLEKSKWQPIFSTGDAAVSVHIPADKGLNDEECKNAFRRAREIYRCYFGEYDFKLFTTETWLLAPELKGFLKPESNILSFQKNFVVFPYKGSGTGVFTFVFKRIVGSACDVDYDTLPEDTSLMRNIKNHYKNGGYVNEFAGLFLFEN